MAAMTVDYPTITHVAQEARPYPTYLLEDAKTGLCLFSAAFMGHNEAIHFAMNGVQTTCIDIDGEKLNKLAVLYPDDWEYVEADAWEFAEESAEVGETWDIVSVDTFRGNATERSLTTIPLWCALANTAVVMTLELGQTFDIPNRWSAETLARNSEVFWLILTRWK